MIKISRVLLIALVVGGIPISSLAQKIRVAAIEIPLMIESPETGVFIDYLKEIDRRSSLDFEISVYPGKRAVSLFEVRAVDILIPYPLESGPPSSTYTTPIHVKKDFAFVRKGRVPPGSIEDLKGLRVGFTKHYHYSPLLLNASGIEKSLNPSDVLNMKMLQAGRIDVFIVEEQSGLRAKKLANTTDLTYDPERPIFTSNTVIVTQESAEGRILAEEISLHLDAMRAEGVLDRLMAKP